MNRVLGDVPRKHEHVRPSRVNKGWWFDTRDGVVGIAYLTRNGWRVDVQNEKTRRWFRAYKETR